MTTMNVNRLAHNVLSTDIKGTRSKIRGDLDLDALGRSWCIGKVCWADK